MNLTTKLGHSRDRKGSAGRKKCSHCVQWRLAWTPGWVVMPFSGFILVLLPDAGDLGETTIRVTITWTLVKIAFCWHVAAAAAAKSLQLCPTLCDPIDGSALGSSVPGILQARTLEWVALSFSNVWKWKVKVKSLSCVWLLATPLTAAHQAPPSMGFSRREYWSGVPLPSPCWHVTVTFKTYTSVIHFA